MHWSTCPSSAPSLLNSWGHSEESAGPVLYGSVSTAGSHLQTVGTGGESPGVSHWCGPGRVGVQVMCLVALLSPCLSSLSGYHRRWHAGIFFSRRRISTGGGDLWFHNEKVSKVGSCEVQCQMLSRSRGGGCRLGSLGLGLSVLHYWERGWRWQVEYST